MIPKACKLLTIDISIVEISGVDRRYVLWSNVKCSEQYSDRHTVQ